MCMYSCENKDGVVGDFHRRQLGMLGDPGVAGAGEQFRAQPGLRQLPCQRMFAPARSQQQDVHAPAYAFR